MKLLPYDSETFSIDADVSTLEARLAPQMAGSSSAGTRPPFAGKIRAGGFEVKPRMLLARVFSPVLFGRWEATPEGTQVKLELIPNRFILAAVFLMFTRMIFITFDARNMLVLQAIAIFLFIAWFISMAGFWLDRGELKQKVRKILRAA